MHNILLLSVLFVGVGCVSDRSRGPYDAASEAGRLDAFDEPDSALELCKSNQTHREVFQRTTGYNVNSKVTRFEGQARVLSRSAERLVIDTSLVGDLERGIAIDSRFGELPALGIGDVVSVEFAGNVLTAIKYKYRLVIRDAQTRLLMALYNEFVSPTAELSFGSEPSVSVRLAESCQLDQGDPPCFEEEKFLDLLVSMGAESTAIPIYEKRILGSTGGQYEIVNLFAKHLAGVRPTCSITDIVLGTELSLSIRKL